MTVFWRDGHWRTSPNGCTHWVESHLVERNDWDRSSSLLGSLQVWDLFPTPPKENGCWPTRCPKCHAPVYFVRHNGGCVWLDSLGHPWPKHPCFDDDLPFRSQVRVVGEGGRWSIGVVSETTPAGDIGTAILINCGLQPDLRGLVKSKTDAQLLPNGRFVVVHQELHDSAQATIFAFNDDLTLAGTCSFLLFRAGMA